MSWSAYRLIIGLLALFGASVFLVMAVRFESPRFVTVREHWDREVQRAKSGAKSAWGSGVIVWLLGTQTRVGVFGMVMVAVAILWLLPLVRD
jgi:hypothetical protein